jgi:hypothetical protein
MQYLVIQQSSPETCISSSEVHVHGGMRACGHVLSAGRCKEAPKRPTHPATRRPPRNVLSPCLYRTPIASAGFLLDHRSSPSQQLCTHCCRCRSRRGCRVAALDSAVSCRSTVQPCSAALGSEFGRGLGVWALVRARAWAIPHFFVPCSMVCARIGARAVSNPRWLSNMLSSAKGHTP